VTRLGIVIAVIVIGTAAPARAWCEATCLAPASTSESHCPTHDPADGTTAVAASSIDDCPVLASARLTAPARLDVQASAISASVPQPPARARVARPASLPRSATTVFERCTPLRI
jgi:hypothetical protein